LAAINSEQIAIHVKLGLILANDNPVVMELIDINLTEIGSGDDTAIAISDLS
jgi:hypothetical protein